MDVFLSCAPPSFGDKVSLTGLKLAYLGRLTVCEPQRFSCFIPLDWNYKHVTVPYFLQVCFGLNSGPHYCAEGVISPTPERSSPG